jgi:hypothetical protein
LLRRIAEELGRPLDVRKPIRVPRSRLSRPGELERAVQLAVRNLGGAGAVLVLVDADDDCPAVTGPEWLRRSHAECPVGVTIRVTLAKAEFESWLLGSVESLRGIRGIAANATAPADPERVRGAKERLRECMQPGRYYSETIDQPALTAQFDLQAARAHCPSFRKLYRDVDALI